jgi:hypothetical protein
LEFGANIERPILKMFLSHCSPTATYEGALPENAAYADNRLDGQRSQRVERLCRATGGRGSPCDFISVHSYNASAVMAAKLKRAKQIALETDAGYYADLWVNSFESCPGWAPPPDVAAADSYLGNGYFPTWCADVVRRQLARAAEDPRYACGETILTFWPWPNQNFRGMNGATRVIAVDENGDGRSDREDTVAMPILSFLELLSSMGDTFRVLPEQNRQVCYREEEVARVRASSRLRVTNESIRAVGPEGALRLAVTVAANGADVVIIQKANGRSDG